VRTHTPHKTHPHSLLAPVTQSRKALFQSFLESQTELLRLAQSRVDGAQESLRTHESRVNEAETLAQSSARNAAEALREESSSEDLQTARHLTQEKCNAASLMRENATIAWNLVKAAELSLYISRSAAALHEELSDGCARLRTETTSATDLASMQLSLQNLREVAMTNHTQRVANAQTAYVDSVVAHANAEADRSAAAVTAMDRD
jgi:hypothetical protein